jgi:membrane fusion protein (multidrug efflux system)
MTSRSIRTLPRAALALGALALAIAVVRVPLHAQPGPGGMPPTVVEAVRPVVDRVSDAVSAVGSLRAAESIVVQPELAGRIEQVHFTEGQSVKAGAPLFTLDASLVRAEVREWEATAAQSQREADLVNSMVARKLIAPAELDTKRSALAVSQARLSSARTRLSKTVIHAAFDGVVGLRQVSPGEYVEIGQPLVNLVQIDPIKLDLRVPQTLLAQVAVGQNLTVAVDAFPGESFTGKVYAIDPQLDADGRSIVLRATVANDDGRLMPGLFARVALELAAREGALLVPEQALWPQGDKQFVYVIDQGKAKLVEITTGVRRDGLVEVRTGLTPEAMVITAGQLKIGPGAAVRIAAPPPAK